ncbi:MAG TPA: malate synthase A [Vicinamibacteria bacterium]|nr:malate synthase A [Vicinamibacteria bacterium]
MAQLDRAAAVDTLCYTGRVEPGMETVLTPEALAFVEDLVREFAPGVERLLDLRQERCERFVRGERPGFLRETACVREADWRVAPPPFDLVDRRVEITGPVDRKMIVNALNSGARVFMADFEDANAPTAGNVVLGQRHLMDAVDGTIRHVAPETGKLYTLGPRTAALMVRPRGLHLQEAHLRLEGRPVPACLVDFGLFFFHNARKLVAKGSGPYFYLPKLENHLEARLWNVVFLRAQQRLALPAGTIRATVLIETVPAAFEMDEILHELRAHSAGLNCGRWDYIFSAIKTLGHDPDWVLPDRAQVTMEQPFLRAYTQLLVKTCHRRGAHAIGGMAAFIPVKDDPEANRAALEKVRADKLREVKDGHDGTWVAHPGLVPVALEVFDAHMPHPNQLQVGRDDVRVTAADLLRPPAGTRSEAGLRHNARVAIVYLESWLRGQGCVPIDNLMEDAATAEISRMQVWQWRRHGARLQDGRPVDGDLVQRVIEEEACRLLVEVGEARFVAGRYREARDLFLRLVTAREAAPFLTVPAYELLLAFDADPRR